ncbi:hypothetical protein [Thermotoga caldifontis]|uniref:hypothetical protein n=1 Tax=Thermotoga caldifontis TaxID=1508419 RepID=UPI00059720C4|nr:hypothetical protein [Thermotoga caldifontis]
MKIENYHVAMVSSYSREHVKRTQERIQITRTPVFEPVRVQQAKFEIKMSEKDKAKLKLIKAILEKLTGRKVKLLLLEISESHESVERTDSGSVQVGVVYERSDYERESETASFSTHGYVETKDGRRIEFEINFHLSRSFERSEFVRLVVGNLQDPLVLKLDDAPLELFNRKLTLDINFDGAVDEIRLPRNAALLVLDLNENGKLDDAHELFGPSTGQGFLELAGYDADRNNWIDENDVVFAKLKLLIADASNVRLVPLLEANVGAIFLGFVRTPFSFYDGAEIVGKINSTGIYLTEDGRIGTVHQLDLKI